MHIRRFLLSNVVVPLYIIAIFGVPAVVTAAIYRAVSGYGPGGFGTVLISVPLYAFLMTVVAGCVSRLTVHAVVAGKFPRDLAHPVYGPRRLYTLCWTSIYYCAPLYHAILAVPALKWLTFRLFGYKGTLDFQTYPDTWMRDLPLLTLGAGVYLSNKATISPNMCLRDGSIVVLPIAIGARSIIGHLTMVAPGANIGADCDIGVGASVGLKATIGDRSVLGHCAQIDHQAVIGSNCHVGSRAYIGRACVIHNGVRIPPGTVVPARTILLAQSDVAGLTINAQSGPPTPMPFNVNALSDTPMMSA